MTTNTFKFSLISDMHLDFPQPKTPYDKLENTVIVAGDTCNGLGGLKFLDKLRHKGFNVCAVDGNHEHYCNLSRNRDVTETTARFRESHSANVEINGVPIILRNGWYPVSDEFAWQHYMNDSRRCVLSGIEANDLAVSHAHYIEQELKAWRDYQKKGVVITHTSPCIETLDPRFKGAPSNEWYWNPQMRRLLAEYSDVILVWCHGHTHNKNEAVVDGVRVVCNPRGYPGENPDWEPMSITVEY